MSIRPSLSSLLCISPLCCFVLCPGAAGQSTLHQLELSAAGGEKLAALGDVDGDGFGDYGYGVADPNVAAVIVSGRHAAVLASLPRSGSIGVPEIARVGDVDGDGLPEVAVRVEGDPTTAVAIHSIAGPAGGPLVASLPFPPGVSTGPDGFGASMAGVGDVDGDGKGDLAIGSPADDRAFVVGSDGTVLLVMTPTVAGFQFGFDVAGLHDDVDGDGRDEVIASSLFEVAVFSVGTGKRLWRQLGPFAGAEYGYSIASMDDLDFDGTRDVAVGAPKSGGPIAGFTAGRVFVHSGTNGAHVKDFGGFFGARFGHSVAGAGVGPNGLPLLLVGEPIVPGVPATINVGFAVLFDAGTGNGFGTATGTTADDGFGKAVAFLGEVNGDGVPDFLASEPDRVVAGAPAPLVRAISGRTLSLTADRVEISLSAGGTQELAFDGVALVGQFWEPIADVLGGRPYLMLGSATGIAPGFDFKGHHVGLNVDAYTLFTASHLIGGFLAPGFGHLDDDGKAAIEFAIPPVAAPSLVGLVLDHACLLFEGEGLGALKGASNSVPVRFTP